MTISISLSGHKEISAALKNMSDQVAQEVGDAVMETAANIEAEVKLRISQGPATGRVYKRRGVSHTASAPGQAPMSDTGALVGSIFHQKEGPLAATAGSRLEYSAFLEYGTLKMAPRPVWQPVVMEEEVAFHKRVIAALTGVVR